MSSVASPFASEYLCLDDLMREVFQQLFRVGDRFTASKGDGLELLGVNLRLTNPRARLSRSEMRGKVFSGLGELFWYLAASNRLDFITHYIPRYREASDDKITIHGAYGPRLFGARKRGEGPKPYKSWGVVRRARAVLGNGRRYGKGAPVCPRISGVDQIRNVVNLLKSRPTSRRAAVQVFFANDLSRHYSDVPCTCTLQMVLRRDALNLIVYMRSNDAYLGLPHDVFAFTMLQEMIARSLGVDVGFYQHMVGSLHLYDEDAGRAEEYLSEKFQTIDPMPPMPKDDPWPLLGALLDAEAAIRKEPRVSLATEFDPYWEDILRLLRVHSENKRKLPDYESRIDTIRSQMCFGTYDVYFL